MKMKAVLLLYILLVGVLNGAGAEMVVSISRSWVRLDAKGDVVIVVAVDLAFERQDDVADEFEASWFVVSGESTLSIPLLLTPEDKEALSEVRHGYRVKMWKELNCGSIPDGSYTIKLCSSSQRSDPVPVTVDRQGIAEADRSGAARMVIFPSEQ